MPHTIISVDPGRTTGLAIGTVTDSTIFKLLHTTNITWEERHKIETYLVPTFDGPDGIIVVVESFNLYPGAAHGQAAIRSDFPSVRIIGLVDAYTHGKFELQPPSIMKRVGILEEHKQAMRGTTPHEKAAYKHLRYYIVTNQEVLLAPNT
jgi:hypothetical protein